MVKVSIDFVVDIRWMDLWMLLVLFCRSRWFFCCISMVLECVVLVWCLRVFSVLVVLVSIGFM